MELADGGDLAAIMAISILAIDFCLRRFRSLTMSLCMNCPTCDISTIRGRFGMKWAAIFPIFEITIGG